MLDFIERYIGVAPDNHSGPIEVFLSVFLIIVMLAIVLRLMITKDDPPVDRSR